MAEQANDAWANVQEIHKDYKSFYQGSGRLIVVIIGMLIVKVVFQNDGDFMKSLAMEILSILTTVLILDWFAERRDERRKIEELQARLVMETGSQSNETVLRAIHELEHRKWLRGKTGLLRQANLGTANLQGAHLEYANLQRANLRYANLQYAYLERADLQEAHLRDANLQGASLINANLHAANLMNANLQKTNFMDANLHETNLRYAKLEGAYLMGVNLQSSNLLNADLEGANLMIAKLQGADLVGVNLREANLSFVMTDERTILPDGNSWTPDADVTQFTNPQHPNFWRSDDPASPAYRGHKS